MEFFRRLIQRFNAFLLKFTRQESTELGENVVDNVPNDVLFMIFRFLSNEQLLIAEQVCLRWKCVVSTCFASRELELGSFEVPGAMVLKEMKRYGPSLKSLNLKIRPDDSQIKNIDWINEIGDAFPNLLSLSLTYTKIVSGSSSVLPVKCCQLTRIKFDECHLTDEDLGIILKGFPGLEYFKLFDHYVYGECFRELGTNIEHLSLTCDELTPAGTSHIFSRCRNLHTLKICSSFECDVRNFSMFCEVTKSHLRKLTFNELRSSKEVFLQISRLSLLEKLKLFVCPHVDSDVLIAISRGCPNLKYVSLDQLPLVCDRGVKAFARCRHLTYLELHFLQSVTGESLFELAKAGTLESVTLIHQLDMDRGVSAILAQCPRLKYLDVVYCPGLDDRTVDAAIQAVESRRCLSATLDQSPHGSSKNSGYLLRLHMSDLYLDQYKGGLSHPLLSLKLFQNYKAQVLVL